MQFSYTEDGWVMLLFLPTFALLFLFPQKITSLLLLAGRLWVPRNNVLETIETSGIETIQIYLESPGGALCNVLSYVFTRKVLITLLLNCYRRTQVQLKGF